jgi:asparagine synthase (glutamine-hydrolysing)
MTAALAHRGPDDSGIWSDPDGGPILGHRRLSILDLSPEGHQPMASRDGSLVLVFNGEIYNHRELRAQLAGQGASFRGRSDTEAMLAAFQAWGVHAALAKMVGMFAFALWDRRSRRLYLSRDRVGEKPLYYGSQAGVFAFASELKAFAHLGWDLEIDRGAVATYVRHGYVPAPHTIYRGIRKLVPGTVFEIDPSRGDEGASVPYWDPRAAVENGIAHRFEGSDSEAVEALEARLSQAILGQMEADVPLGTFLSGGIDSSLITALMQKQSANKVRTFTIGFREERFNEAPYARDVAAHLGTDHTELYVEGRDALDVIPSLASIYDEPFSDYSQIPTYLVSKLTRSKVTVCLSGDGGDELFFGYPRYAQALSAWERVSRLPASLRRPLGGALRAVPGAAADAAFGWAGPLLARRGRDPSVARHFDRLGRLLGHAAPAGLYREFVSHAQEPSRLARHGREAATVFTDPAACPRGAGPGEIMMFLDLVSYLPDAIMTKVDRASMAVSLETRAPFLDHRVVEFAWSLPMRFKVRNGRPKYLLRELLYRHVPAALIDRPKMGFGFPVADWLRGPLRDWAEALLDPERIRREGLLEAAPIARMWEDHLSGVRDSYSRLWDILMFQAWLESAPRGVVASAEARK